ncbi:YadA-like family protein [Vibrio chagasii]
MDGIRASLHAVTNARPFVTNGEFAIGAGVGFAGSKEALALGGAYGINESLSVSGTFHYETSGKYSSSDVAGGVGLQYSFK